MLVLSRRTREEVIITVGDERIVVSVVDLTRYGKARLGFKASERVTIHRREIQELVERNSPSAR